MTCHRPFLSGTDKSQAYTPCCFAHLNLANQYSAAILFNLFLKGIYVDSNVVTDTGCVSVELDVHIESTCNITQKFSEENSDFSLVCL